MLRSNRSLRGCWQTPRRYVFVPRYSRTPPSVIHTRGRHAHVGRVARSEGGMKKTIIIPAECGERDSVAGNATIVGTLIEIRVNDKSGRRPALSSQPKSDAPQDALPVHASRLPCWRRTCRTGQLGCEPAHCAVRVTARRLAPAKQHRPLPNRRRIAELRL
jgi:hypothetical protein